MTRRNRLILIAVAAVATIALGLRYAARQSTADSRFHGDVAHRVFDPSRDALQDLQTAEQQARTQHKNILIDVGGNWCPSCIVLDRTLQSDPVLRTLLAQNYVLLHVNWSSDNENKPLLSRYPQAHGYPALYVLSPTGQLVVAEDTSVFEQHPDHGETYNHASLQAFFSRYGPT